MKKYSVYYQPRELLDVYGAAEVPANEPGGVSRSPITVTGDCIRETVPVPSEIMNAFGSRVDHTSVSLVTDSGAHYPLLFTMGDTLPGIGRGTGMFEPIQGNDTDYLIASCVGKRTTIQGTAFNNYFLLPERFFEGYTQSPAPALTCPEGWSDCSNFPADATDVIVHKDYHNCCQRVVTGGGAGDGGTTVTGGGTGGTDVTGGAGGTDGTTDTGGTDTGTDGAGDGGIAPEPDVDVTPTPPPQIWEHPYFLPAIIGLAAIGAIAFALNRGAGK